MKPKNFIEKFEEPFEVSYDKEHYLVTVGLRLSAKADISLELINQVPNPTEITNAVKKQILAKLSAELTRITRETYGGIAEPRRIV